MEEQNRLITNAVADAMSFYIAKIIRLESCVYVEGNFHFKIRIA